MLNQLSFTVIGVTEPGFQGHVAVMNAGVWVPMGLSPQMTGRSDMDSYRSHWLELIGRRREPATRAQLAQALSAIEINTAKAQGQDAAGVDVRQYAPIPAAAILPVGGFVGLLLVICGTVLLIASVNVGSILLSRATARSREIAVRLALGAGRGRLVRQFLTESVLLFLLGGTLGVAVALGATRALAAVSLPLGIPMNPDFHPDITVLVAALVVTLITGIVFGLAPALQTTRPDLARAVREEGLTAGAPTLPPAERAGHRPGRGIGGIAGGGRSLRPRAGAGGPVDLGFNPAGLYVAQVDLSVHHYTDDQKARFAEEVVGAVAAQPGITAAAGSDAMPLNNFRRETVISLPGREQRENVGRFQIDFADVTPGYFATFQIPMLRGRDFTSADRQGAPLVAILNESLARQLWPSEEATGKQFMMDSTAVEVIGVARDSKYNSISEDPDPFMYLPYAQSGGRDLEIIARAAGGASPVSVLRQAVRDADPNLPLLELAPVSQIIGLSLLPSRVAAIMAAAFGGIGLLLTGVGLYGILAYAVARRRREIGVRMALGASSRDVIRLVLRDGLRLTGIGLLIGFGLALGATRLLRGLLFGLSPLDPLTFSVIAVLVILVALLASGGPARRATRTDPMEAIRHD